MLCHTSASVDLDETATITIHHKVDRLLGRHGFTEQDRDDLEQDLAIDLLQRLRHFDPLRAQRSTFIARCIEHRISDLIRHGRRAVRDPRRVCRLGDEQDGSESDAAAARLADEHAADVARRRNDLRLDVGDVIARLPPRLAQICNLLHDHTAHAIAHVLGVSKNSVYRDIAAIRARFLAAGLDGNP